ncbi:MAG: 4-(cytidine 5'-diphospho)-2-C-methyl-D-erythritol kinase [Brevundimonas sp.]|nr:MAG: 4-(cytidine 5'-diphospho)-2-C-methyl-D-erythritol kinase [Brevundimonas sp.]
MSLTAFAPAKVNLLLHVGPPGADGFHPLVSLAAFADVGDRLSLIEGAAPGLTVGGRLAGDAPAGLDNLALRAVTDLAAALGRPQDLAIRLDKELPMAAGLGGGSADAAAALRLAARAWGVALDDPRLIAVAQVLGSDVPMCLVSRPVWGEGRGEVLSMADWLAPLHAVLVNPGVASPTGPVYRAYDADPRPLDPRPEPPEDRSFGAVIDWLHAQRNDLEPPAVRLAPAIEAAVAAVRADPDVALARMSGSGATVFGLCAGAEDASAAARRLARPGWWVRACVLGTPGGT